MEKEEEIKLLINKVRYLQGWGPLSGEELDNVYTTWKYYLDKYGVPHELYSILIDKAVDIRVFSARNKERPPALTVEFIIQLYQKYRESMYGKLNDLKLLRQQLMHDFLKYKDKEMTKDELIHTFGPIAKSFNVSITDARSCEKFIEHLDKEISEFPEKNFLIHKQEVAQIDEIQ